MLGLLGVVVSGWSLPIGAGCTPVAIVGGVSRNENVVCCVQDCESEQPRRNGVPTCI
jgi:hypothetical protein